MRVRDEVKMTILAYQTLYESSIAYGMRKAMQAEQSKAEKLNKISSLKQICHENDEQINKLKQTILDMLEQEQRDKIESETAHNETYSGQYDGNQKLAKDLQALLVKINGQ